MSGLSVVLVGLTLSACNGLSKYSFRFVKRFWLMFYLFISTNNSSENLCYISILTLCCLDLNIFFYHHNKELLFIFQRGTFVSSVYLNFNAPSALRINQYRKILKILFLCNINLLASCIIKEPSCLYALNPSGHSCSLMTWFSLLYCWPIILHKAESNMSALLILLLYELIIQEYSLLSWFSGIGIFKTR